VSAYVEVPSVYLIEGRSTGGNVDVFWERAVRYGVRNERGVMMRLITRPAAGEAEFPAFVFFEYRPV
jgi:hypothetical protein